MPLKNAQVELAILCNIYKFLKTFSKGKNRCEIAPKIRCEISHLMRGIDTRRKKCTTHVGESSPKHTSLTNFAKKLQFSRVKRPQKLRKTILIYEDMFLARSYLSPATGYSPKVRCPVTGMKYKQHHKPGSLIHPNHDCCGI